MADFGLSKPGVQAVSGSATEGIQEELATKSFVGTKEYVAPEVHSSSPNVIERILSCVPAFVCAGASVCVLCNPLQLASSLTI